MEALFVAVKDDLLSAITDVIEDFSKEIISVEISPTSFFNAARANGIGQEQCEIILNIGGRCSNLVFVDHGRIFARTIPIAGHSITQQIAKEFNISFEDAEELKRRHCFVALGGAYADPGSETAATVSKIIRNVMSRLHGEISRSINIYRAQQRGNAPTKIYLTGGSSILTYCDVFFAEKFNVPVEYFNPFQVLELAPNVDRAKLGEVAHMFSEVLGLAFRYSRPCPIEINLLPRRIMRQQALLSKKPYFVTIMLCILAALGLLYKGNNTAVVESKYRQDFYSAERA
jgi:type IV pilus assembly protein PilM